MKTELHCHSACSDGSASVMEILEYAECIGIGAVAITDHDKIDSVAQAKKYKGDILFIPGIEVSSTKGHILVLGVEEKPPKDFYNALDFAHARDAVVIAAHPFGGTMRPGAADVLGKVTAVEVLNGKTFPWANRKAMKAAAPYNKVSGSDAHLLREVGSFACSIHANSVDGILREIRKGRVELPDKQTKAADILMSTLKSKVSRIRI